MTRTLVLTLLVAFATACHAGPETNDVPPQEVLAASGESSAPLILDVRTPEEFAAGHVPGAVNIPHDQVAARVDEIAGHRKQEVVLYCERGGRAAKARDALAGAGFTQLRHLEGDMSAWRAAGLPIER